MKTTEQNSNYNDIELMPTAALLAAINAEDKKVAFAVTEVLPSISELIEKGAELLKKGGRLFYIGAGTSGRLGIVDASECPPTFGVAFDTVIGIIAGGDSAIRKAAEFAEDDEQQAWKDLQNHNINQNDFLIGISASGSTPYVYGGLKEAQKNGLITGAISCNYGAKISSVANYPIEVELGPEFITGSSRMKSGTAQKMILNMISTGIMVKLGKIKGNKMIDMQLSNHKLIERGTRFIIEATGVNEEKARAMLLNKGSVRAAINALNNA